MGTGSGLPRGVLVDSCMQRRRGGEAGAIRCKAVLSYEEGDLPCKGGSLREVEKVPKHQARSRSVLHTKEGRAPVRGGAPTPSFVIQARAGESWRQIQAVQETCVERRGPGTKITF